MHGSTRRLERSVIHARKIEHLFKKVYREDSFSIQRGRCAYCETPLPRTKATADHRIPLDKNGATSRENIVMACLGCNQAKSSMSAGQFRNMLNAKEPPPWSNFERVKAWIRFKLNKRIKKAERRIKRYVGMAEEKS